MNKVKIYTTPACYFCKKTKEFFKRHNIEYEEYDVTDDLEKREEMITLSGQFGVPVIVTNNDMWVGYNENKLNKLLNGGD